VKSVLRRSTVAVAATAVVLSAGGASLAVAGSGAQAASQPIKGGHSSVALDSKTVNALFGDGFGVSSTGRAKINGTTFTVRFPLTGGSYTSPTKGTIREAGGIKVTKGKKHVTVRNITLNLRKGSGTAIVSGHGRMSAVTIGAAQGGSQNSFSGYPVRLSRPLIRVLDKKFHTKAFRQNKKLGTGSTTMKFK
jgi:hypothetical protein